MLILKGFFVVVLGAAGYAAMSGSADAAAPASVPGAFHPQASLTTIFEPLLN